MKRKTNLFYTDGPDSNFLTFSNYTEYLTGNFVSADYKLFPSKFICLYIPQLCKENSEETDATKKSDFIKNWLVGYYENKLAMMRDYCVENKYNQEISISPLAYLIETLRNYDSNNDNIEYFNSKYNIHKGNIELSYIGNITEQNYNGTYTDSICIIDGNEYIQGMILQSANASINNDSIVSSNNTLYGWTSSELPEIYRSSDIHFDDENSHLYKLNSSFGPILLVKPNSLDSNSEDTHNYNSNTNSHKIKFNCIIPLFDIVNIDYNTNSANIDLISGELLENNNMHNNNIINIPFGIWIAPKTVILERNAELSNQFPLWSLVISSQFKALPYFKGITSEYGTIDTTDLYDNAYNNAYATFAQVLSRQNTIMNTFNMILSDFTQMKDKLNQLENKLNKFESTSMINNSDIMQRQIIDAKNELKDDMTSFKSYIENTILGNLKWKVAT